MNKYFLQQTIQTTQPPVLTPIRGQKKNNDHEDTEIITPQTATASATVAVATAAIPKATATAMLTKNGKNLASDDEYSEEEHTPTSSHRTAAKPNDTVTATGNCNLGTKDIVINKPFDISNCTQQQIKELKQACNRNNNIKIIMKDNKTVKYHRVDTTINNNTFTCKELDWFTLATDDRYGTIDVWDSETQPTNTQCTNTCNAIKTVTDPKKNIFPLNNPQCVKVCDSYVKKACDGLLWENDGEKKITEIKQITYKMEQDGKFTYQCNYTYK